MRIPKLETSRAKQGFRDYYELGVHRSLEKLYQKYSVDTPNSPTKSLYTLKKWSIAFNWQARVVEEDRKLQEAWEREQRIAVIEMKRKQVEEGAELQDLGREVVRKYLKMVKEALVEGESIPEEVIEKISVNIARFLIIEGAKLESLARGEPTEIGRSEIEATVEASREEPTFRSTQEEDEYYRQKRRVELIEELEGFDIPYTEKKLDLFLRAWELLTERAYNQLADIHLLIFAGEGDGYFEASQKIETVEDVFKAIEDHKLEMEEWTSRAQRRGDKDDSQNE